MDGMTTMGASKLGTWGLVGALATCVAAAPLTAHAVSIEGADCNFGFEDSYNPGDAVCVTGDLDVVPPGGICGEAYVIVRPAGAANPFFDVTPSANYIQGCAGAGAFFDEIVWLPPLVPGQYDLVIDQWPFFGDFGPEDYQNLNAITVTNAPLVFSVDVAAIKGAAADGLAYAQALHDLTVYLTIIDTLSTAADWAIAFGSGGALAGIGLGVACYGLGVDCPTSYNSAVISIGNRIIGHQSDALTLHYGAIIADPPDPAFDVVVPLVLTDATASGPWTPAAGAPVVGSQVDVARLMSIQAAAYQALVPSLEKLQGAQQADSHVGRLIQSEKVLAYTNLALSAGDAMLTELDAMEATLTDAGVYDVEAPMATAMVQSVIDDGLSAEDEAVLNSFGYTLDDLQTGVTALGDVQPPPVVSWAATIDAARQSFEQIRPGLTDMVTQAENIRTENEPYSLRVGPALSLSGSPTANVGETMTVTASVDHNDPDAVVDISWDTDGDGEFDDGTGLSVEVMPTHPGLLPISAQADDGALLDVVFMTIDVAATNAAPEFVVTGPETAPFAEVDETLTLHAEASDPDTDPVTLTWTIDGVEVGSGEDYDFTMPDDEPHLVTVVAADDNMFTPDARFVFHVRAAKWQDVEPGDDGGVDDTGGGTGGGSDAGDAGDATGGAADGASGSGTGADGTAGDGGAADGGAAENGCSCRSTPSPAPTALWLLGLVALRRRRRR